MYLHITQRNSYTGTCTAAACSRQQHTLTPRRANIRITLSGDGTIALFPAALHPLSLPPSRLTSARLQYGRPSPPAARRLQEHGGDGDARAQPLGVQGEGGTRPP